MQYFNFVENENVRMMSINNRDIDPISRIMVKSFNVSGLGRLNMVDSILESDFNISKKLVVGNRVIGFYLLAPRSIFKELPRNCKIVGDLNKYKNKRGVEGIALAIIPEFRGKGYGNLLKDLPKTLGFDYVFGGQMKKLNNLDDWLKRRELIADGGDCWITAELFK
jgi:hypothetical protein